ncbi:Prenylated Rab acceptor protein 1 [Elasticomyces elasticus]|nr:Prenylated Rab acceptor protein 1 [Elasticomyces elasticus]
MPSIFTLSTLALASLPLLSAAPTSYGSASWTAVDDDTPEVPGWAEGAVTEYPIHASCNHSETALLRQGLDDAETLAAHARDHIHRFGNNSVYYLKYFGKAPTGEAAGWFDKVVNGDKAGVLFRCDDPDTNCATQDGWAGHWRGENGTDENVICELSFTVKWPLAGMCSYGYTVAGSSASAYFGSDLIHRLYHTDKIGEGVVGHYADEYEECLQLAIDSPEEAVRNSATLRYFALDVYAYDIAEPGVGCTGEPVSAEAEVVVVESTSSSAAVASTTSAPESSTSVAESSSSAASIEVTTSSAAPESTEAATPASAAPASTVATVTTSAGTECHTHADGEVHCV